MVEKLRVDLLAYLFFDTDAGHKLIVDRGGLLLFEWLLDDGVNDLNFGEHGI
jgi:hypothetical protein